MVRSLGCGQLRSPVPECPHQLPGAALGTREESRPGPRACGGWEPGRRKSVTDRAPLSPAGEVPKAAGGLLPRRQETGSTQRVCRLSRAGGKAAAEVSPQPSHPWGLLGRIAASVVTAHSHQEAQSQEGLVAGGLQDPAQHTRVTPRPVGFRWEPRFPSAFLVLLVNART